jgi:predicted PhzF superfamily epimerase YddE/YHI9
MRQWTIDAFTAELFRGNPAAVVEPFDAWPDEVWMQRLAAENNLSETAFLLRTEDPARFGLRWFTPTTEVPLCGHATLATTHALFAEMGLAAGQIAFDTLSGPLQVSRLGGLYEMDFPAGPPRRVEPPPGLIEGLGVTPKEVWVASYLIAVLEDEAQVRGVMPNYALLDSVSAGAPQLPGNVGVCALAAAGASYDVVDRFFAPGLGVPEDPVCGSMHCILAPLYADKLGRDVIRFHQAYPGRGGDLECELRGDRVLLRGAARTFLEGVIRV